jgi:hypothetical protein
MSRLKQKAERRRQEAQNQEQVGFWPELCRRIDAGQVIPIISNSVFNDHIFDMDGDGILGISSGDENPQGWSIEEQLADAWAYEVRFPLTEQHWLPRVALFDRVVNSRDDLDGKTRYLDWLKDSLLTLAEDDEEVDPDTLEELRDDLQQNSFADIAVELGYPRPVQGIADPLALMARLKLPIYITTSPFDFLERAIMAERRQPRTQVCFWSEEPVTYLDAEHKTDYDFTPTAENPLVYHLFGLEAYPESMVLNEDDYLDFLAKISKDMVQKRPLLPLYLRKAITQSSLILLGYRLRDWDFRVMYRGLINQNRAASAEQICTYLEKYFGGSNFTVEWDSSHGFMDALWEAWQRWLS